MVTKKKSKFITVKKAAELVNVTPHYIRKLLRTRKLEGDVTPETGRWSVDPNSLEKFRKTDVYKQDVEMMRIQLKINIKEAVENVEEDFQGDLISYIATPNSRLSTINQSDCLLLDDLLYTQNHPFKEGKDRKYQRIILFVHSPGGILEATIKFVDIIRQYANEFYVIVPIMAKSAATLMVLKADRIFFTSLSELGPVDPMIQSPSKPDVLVPATAIDSFIKYYGKNSEDSSESNTVLLKKLEENFDPFLIGAHKKALDFSKAEIKKALKEYSMKDRTNNEIENAVKKFTSEYHSHSYPITFTELERFGIGEKIEDGDKLKSIKILFGVYQQFMANSKIVKLIGNRDTNKNIKDISTASAEQIPTKTSL